jgi:GT2 family glycosyltransferase
MRVELILWGEADQVQQVEWPLGPQHRVSYQPIAAHAAIRECLDEGDSDYLLLWHADFGLPDPSVVLRLTQEGDVIHSGLCVGTRGMPEELDYVSGEWSLLDSDADSRTTSWRVALRCCLVSTAMLRTLGQIDPAFTTIDMAGLEAGLRWLRRGAIIWHDPALLGDGARSEGPLTFPLRDRYLFLERTYRSCWSRYVLFRRCLNSGRLISELAAYREAGSAAATPPPRRAVWERSECADHHTSLAHARVSVVIPTLGRYPYLPGALESLRNQSLRPFEVICVDQNPPNERQPELYRQYEDLNLKVLWQNERGQSLARNTALVQASGDYVFLFDDDSVAAPDAIEQHLRVLLRYGADSSTGVSLPPPPEPYTLPEVFSFLRVAQTFDSGNSVLNRQAIQRVGGFDRAYDHGVNTDLDLGTRLYLSGGLIIHNPLATRVHYKAPSGGLRTYGAWWAHRTQGLLRPFPAPTQLYYMLRFLSRRQRLSRLGLLMLVALAPRDARRQTVDRSKLQTTIRSLCFLAAVPLRLFRAYSQAGRLLRAGPKIPCGSNLPQKATCDPTHGSEPTGLAYGKAIQ